MKIQIHQIYYDQASKNELDEGFIPLDNSDTVNSGWFEFWPILKFLNETNLEGNTWYGFLSPKFKQKTGIDSKALKEILESNDFRANVLLASPGWDQIAFFMNVFEQGDLYHPGLFDLSQQFIDSVKMDINLNKIVMDSSNSVFSNYVIAKKDYWLRWKEIANIFFEHVNLYPEYQLKNKSIYYKDYPIKAFIQERLASLVLTKYSFPTISIDQSECGPINTILFQDNSETRRLLRQCNELKSSFRRTNNYEYLKRYWETRYKVNFTNPFDARIDK